MVKWNEEYPEGDKNKKNFVAIRMDHNLFETLKEKAQAEGKDLSRIIRDLIKEGLKA